MNKNQYNSKIHNRKSIRLKGHDYAGGGLYFVTICAHRDFVRAAKGRPFWLGEGATRMSLGEGATRMSLGEGATRMSPVREIIAEEMQRTADLLPWMHWKAHAIMPDHFHALIEMQGGHGKLGDVVGGFKAGVTRSLRRGGILPARILPARILPARILPAHGIDKMPIWHRNYYEMIVRDEEAERNISEYIRMNPWKLIISGSYEGRHFRAIGNPNLMNLPKIGVLCSRRVPRGVNLEPPECDAVFMSGFHSPPEREILNRLLNSRAKIICCPSWGIDRLRIPSEWMPALEENRMMIMEMTNREGNLAASEERNRFVLNVSDDQWIPHVNPGGMLDRLVNERGIIGI